MSSSNPRKLVTETDQAKNEVKLEPRRMGLEKLDINKILREEHYKYCPQVAKSLQECVTENHGVVENCWEQYMMIRDCTEKYEKGLI